LISEAQLYMPSFLVPVVIMLYSSICLAQLVPFAFWQRNPINPSCTTGSPPIGTVCEGGAIYAGEFDGGKYMITPSGCNDSATPTCDGSTDSLNKRWLGSTGSEVDIPGLINVTAAATKSTQRGHETTPIITAHSSISSDSAAHYCENMTYGGYSDWYLPSKSELAYLYCKANVSAHNASNPQEEPNCVGYGGKTSELQGFASASYWSSTQRSFIDAWPQSFSNGSQFSFDKYFNSHVRCARRYYSPGEDITPNTIQWADFENESSVETFAGIDTNIMVEISAVDVTGSATLEYRKNGGAWTVFTVATPASVSFEVDDTLQFRVSGTLGDSADIQVRNTTDSNAWLDFSTIGTVVDPCETVSPPVGTVCEGGAIYAGEFDGGKYMVTPSGCSDSSTPTCDGSTDSLTKFWRGSTGISEDIPGLVNIGERSTRSTQRGHETTPIITHHSSISSDSAAHYCENMTFGGYSDWYLPSKSERAYLHCKSNVSAHDPSFPEEDPNCVTYGGKTTQLEGFSTLTYWTSNEVGVFNAWRQLGDTGEQSHTGKGSSRMIRCIRRFYPLGEDITPNTIQWANFDNESSTESFVGIDTVISVEILGTHLSGTPTLEFRKNGGAWTAFTPADPATVSIEVGDTLQFRVSGSDGDSANIQVRNITDGNAWLDFTTVGSVTSPDPCDGDPAIGTECLGGALYLGVFQGGKYMITPGGCTDSPTPTCDGGTDTVTRTWAGDSGSYGDISGVTNIGDSWMPSPESERGDVITPLIVASGLTSANSAAAFCQNMTYGGYSDWYLPSKSELAYVYCKTNTPSHNINYPDESPNCVGADYGGKTADLPLTTDNAYIASTPLWTNGGWVQAMVSGQQWSTDKFWDEPVRCVRRY
jgi:hypothetical protein